MNFDLFEGYSGGYNNWLKEYWRQKDSNPDDVSRWSHKINEASVEIVLKKEDSDQDRLKSFYDAQHELAKNTLPPQTIATGANVDLFSQQYHRKEDFSDYNTFSGKAGEPFHGRTTYSKCGHVSNCKCSGPHRGEPRILNELCPLCNSKAGDFNPKEPFVNFKKKPGELEIDPNTAFQKIYPFPFGREISTNVNLKPMDSGIANSGLNDMQKLNEVDWIGNRYLPNQTQDGKSKDYLPPEFQLSSANQKVSLGCLMAMVPSEYSSQFVNFATKNIETNSLHEKGFEPESHVTVLYGFNENFNPDKLQKMLASSGPISFTLGEVGRFECPEYDVLHLKVSSPDLEMLNAKISREFAANIENSNYKYTPHLTLAYVNKRSNLHMEGMTLGKKTFGVAKLMYSPSGQNKPRTISLAWDAQKYSDLDFQDGVGQKGAPEKKPFGTNFGDKLQEFLIKKSEDRISQEKSIDDQLKKTLEEKQKPR